MEYSFLCQEEVVHDKAELTWLEKRDKVLVEAAGWGE
jgi:hypothetical protein